MLAEDPMLIIGIVNIRQALKTACQALSDFRFADVALTPRFWRAACAERVYTSLAQLPTTRLLPGLTVTG